MAYIFVTGSSLFDFFERDRIRDIDVTLTYYFGGFDFDRGRGTYGDDRISPNIHMIIESDS